MSNHYKESEMSDESKIIPITDHLGEANQKVKWELTVIFGTVTSITDMPAVNAVAFTVKHGGRETMFWLSTALEAKDRDYRKPLMGESLKIWFSEAARSIDVGGEKALGVVEIQNLSNDSEQEAFRWFRENPDGLPWLKKP